MSERYLKNVLKRSYIPILDFVWAIIRWYWDYYPKDDSHICIFILLYLKI